MKILIVEDSDMMTEVLVRQLSDLGEIVTARNIFDALEIMRRNPPPDFVILDLVLAADGQYPATTGKTTLEKIREFKSINTDAFVMVLTGTTEDIRDMALAFGADGFHQKMSVSSQEKLLGAVRDVLLSPRPEDGPKYKRSSEMLSYVNRLLTGGSGAVPASVSGLTA